MKPCMEPTTTTTQTQKDFSEMFLYKLDENELIGAIEVTERVASRKTIPEMVVIIDKSGSMLDSVHRLTQEILPLFFSKLAYDAKHIVHLVYFHSHAESYSLPVGDVESLRMYCDGRTKMSLGIQSCQKVFNKFEKTTHKPIRLLTISDGEVDDKEDTEKAASVLADYLKSHGFSINSQAVRLFTSDNEPDTTALCSLLQVNNTTNPQLVDISTSDRNEVIAKKMANLFENDNLSDGQSIVSKSHIFYKFPWLPSPSAKLVLVPGNNLLWLKSVPTEGDIKILGTPVKVVMQGSLTKAKFLSLVESQLFYIVDHMKVLKVIGSEEANKTIQQIVQYFEDVEAKLAQKSIAQKLFNIGSDDKKISSVLARINDDNVESLDLAQQAAYLRDDGHIKDQLRSIKSNASDIGYELHVSRNSLVAFFAGAAVVSFIFSIASVVDLLRSAEFHYNLIVFFAGAVAYKIFQH